MDNSSISEKQDSFGHSNTSHSLKAGWKLTCLDFPIKNLPIFALFNKIYNFNTSTGYQRYNIPIYNGGHKMQVWHHNEILFYQVTYNYYSFFLSKVSCSYHL